jgi:hypothetical protein
MVPRHGLGASTIQAVFGPRLFVVCPNRQIRVCIRFFISAVITIRFRRRVNGGERQGKHVRIDILLCGEVRGVTARVDGILALVYSDIIYQHRRRESKVHCIDIAESFRDTQIGNKVLQRRKLIISMYGRAIAGDLPWVRGV